MKAFWVNFFKNLVINERLDLTYFLNKILIETLHGIEEDLNCVSFWVTFHVPTIFETTGKKVLDLWSVVACSL